MQFTQSQKKDVKTMGVVSLQFLRCFIYSSFPSASLWSCIMFAWACIPVIWCDIV